MLFTLYNYHTVIWKTDSFLLFISTRYNIVTITPQKEVTDFLSKSTFFYFLFLNTKMSGIYRQLLYKTYIQLLLSNKQPNVVVKSYTFPPYPTHHSCHSNYHPFPRTVCKCRWVYKTRGVRALNV